MDTEAVVATRPTTGPAPDLIDYRVAHRAMTVDIARLATAAGELVERPDPARLRALRRYLEGMRGEIENHHRVEDEHVWPALEAVAGTTVSLTPLTEDHDRLDPLLRRASVLAAGDRAGPELAAVMRELSALLERHIDDEERKIFPLIEHHLSRAEYRELQRHFRRGLDPRLLAFVVPWMVGHADAAERRALLADAGLPLRLLLALTERPFASRRRRLFGPPISRRDRWMVGLMRRVARAHRLVLSATGGRVGRTWLGGTDIVLLTVVGRRSGRPSTVPLMSLRDGADLVVVASHGGVDREPPWWLNLQAEPRAMARVRGERFPVVASQVHGAERDALWDRFVAAYAGFTGYQAGVRRQIAVVRLRRTG
ncbi:nitroreductase/quinone reductase family protein [Actinomycetospora straminea]|uniref:Hemerythrin-like domain-containing protein n=1 Tax=Actinomycetospora straminea TaxID=663607 RepID=A0ABP9EM04_9PSEU|nr:nitroreductase/quinone reductase family protein [Actinomycetospora straminea]MDD7934993.1 nitroreductase/quinone reductase family protein [Actinomycetospora straminea]